jgi:hypothetical protein
MELSLGISNECEPKHLRVGVNSALRDQASLVKLLVAKGIIAESEYVDAIVAGANEEADSYEARLSKRLGRPVTLV